MRKHNFLRSALALFALVAIAGPGVVLADFDPSYVPKIIQLIGPSSVAVTTEADYRAYVTFTNGQTAFVTSAEGVVFSAARGSISADGHYTAPATTGRDSIKATFTQQGVTVSGAKIILNGP